MTPLDPRQAALEASSAYTTAELTTVNPAGFPVTIPVVTAFDESSGKIVFSTSIAYPAKIRNIRSNPAALFHYHNRIALRPELGEHWEHEAIHPDAPSVSQARAGTPTIGPNPPRYAIRAKASVLELDFERAMVFIGQRFRSARVQPGLYRRLGRPWWARLYRYYFSRLVVEAEPEEVQGQVVVADSLKAERMSRRPLRRLSIVERLILRYAPAASVSLIDSLGRPAATEVRVQAVAPTLVCAAAAPGSISTENLASSEMDPTRALACISAFGQSSDLGYLFHCSAMGIAEIKGGQIRLSPLASFHTLRPPGVIGDLWTGLDSARKGRAHAARAGVTPLRVEFLEASFGRRK